MSRNLLTWWCIFSYVLVLPISATGWLLCIGEDGHIAIEYNSKSGCAEPLSDEHHSSHDFSGTHCGACTDLLLSQSNQISNSRSNSDLESKAILFIAKKPQIPIINSKKAISPPLPYAFLVPPSDLLSLRTTILLI